MSTRRRAENDIVKVMCTLDLGRRNIDLLFVSETMNSRYRQVNTFLPMERLRKELVDYCLLEHITMDVDEVLLHFGRFEYITRQEMVSLNMFRYIFVNIIDAWCSYLNQSDEPNRFYFNLVWQEPFNHIVFPDEKNKKDPLECKEQMRKSWKIWVEMRPNWINQLKAAKLVFLPIFYKEIKHFSSICINFEMQSIQYMDNMIHEDDFVTEICELVKGEVVIFMNEMKHPDASNLKNFNMEVVKFSWAQKKVDNVDCGIFTMMHMFVFEGHRFFEPNLKSAYERRYIRAWICSTLVLADMNMKREEVLKKVAAFNLSKPSIIECIEEERVAAKKEAQEAKKKGARKVTKKVAKKAVK